MNVGFLIYSLGGGGAERVLTELANELSRRGNTISIFLYDDKQTKYDVDENIRVINISKEHGGNNESYFSKCLRLRRMIKREKVDILVAFSISMIGIGRFATLGTSIKIIGSERTNPQRYSGNKRYIMKYIAPFCDGMIFQTEGVKTLYSKRNQRKSIVIPNPAPKTEITDRIMYDKHIKICTISSLRPPKDIETIVKAYKLFSEDYPESSLVIYGEGILKTDLEKSIKDNNLENKVVLAGFQKDILSLIKTYDMFVFSSKSEGMPNALLEAMAAGLPCIATDCRFGPNELIEDGKNGFLVPIGDYELMAEKMKWIAENAEEARKIGKTASCIQRLYSKDLIHNNYIQYIEKIWEDQKGFIR